MADGVIKGPRPLSLHFSNSQIIWGAAAEAGSSALEEGLWHPDLSERIAVLKRKVPASSRVAFDEAIREKAATRRLTFLTGINRYLSYEYIRPRSKADVCLRLGDVELLDFGGNGKPLLLVPSLINPHYILDLMPGRSLIDYLKKRGYRPYLVNWGQPGEDERHFGLDDYITQRLEPILDYVSGVAGKPVPVVGYCMGGTLSLGLAARAASHISCLALLAAPWDFGTDRPHAGRKFVPAMIKKLERMPEGCTIGVDMLQTFFASVDPTLNDRKFRSYAMGKYQGAHAEFFSAMEVWANNGAPLAHRVASECLSGWYRDNDTMQGRWKIAGTTVRPQDITCPTWVAAPEGDRLVPQESAFAVLQQLPNAVRHVPPSGHIGMVVGDRAENGLWKPLVDWLGGVHAS